MRITQYSQNRNLLRQNAANIRFPKAGIGGCDLRKIRRIQSKGSADLRVPRKGVYIEQLRAGSIGIVCSIAFSVRHAMNQPGINGSKAQFMTHGLLLCAWDILHQPSKFGGWEKGRNGNTGGFADMFAPAGIHYPLAHILGPAALPDNGIGNGQSGHFIPANRGLPLIGDA